MESNIGSDSTTTIRTVITRVSMSETVSVQSRGITSTVRLARVHGSEERETALRVLAEAGGLLLPRESGVRLKGWRIESRKGAILTARETQRWEQSLKAFRLPEMVFGDSSLELTHESSGIVLFFNAWEALNGWMKEKLPPVQIPAAVRWMQRTKPSKELILDYDYTFTTAYCGSEKLESSSDLEHATERLSLSSGERPEETSLPCFAKQSSGTELNLPLGNSEGFREEESTSTISPERKLVWEECSDTIDWEMLQERDPILFYNEVVLYEDELADNGIALCSVKVRVMSRCWFVLLRFWLRVDGVLIRLRDTRVFCRFSENPSDTPLILRERSRREATFQELSALGSPTDSVFYADPNVAGNKLPELHRNREKLVLK